MFPLIKTNKKIGNESFINTSLTDITLADFWSWAYSDLIGNTERGKLAEFIVAIAMGIHEGLSVSWEKYDLLSTNGIRIEVKASGYIQTWDQKNESKIIFTIKPTLGWDSETNAYENEKKRQSDVYVFCVLKHKDQTTINPLDLAQWDFYVLSTTVLNEAVPVQRKITLNRLVGFGAVHCDFNNLKATIYAQHI